MLQMIVALVYLFFLAFNVPIPYVSYYDFVSFSPEEENINFNIIHQQINYFNFVPPQILYLYSEFIRIYRQLILSPHKQKLLKSIKSDILLTLQLSQLVCLLSSQNTFAPLVVSYQQNFIQVILIVCSVQFDQLVDLLLIQDQL